MSKFYWSCTVHRKKKAANKTVEMGVIMIGGKYTNLI